MGTGQERRLVFGGEAARYDRYRPSYPAALVNQVVGLVGADARVIDVGCGTGKGTRLLADAGLTGVGVEPDTAMADVARSHLRRCAGWRVDVSDFETWRPRDGDTPVDLVTSAQAWHWVDPAVGLRQAHRLLRPGGWMALWWNLADRSELTTLGHAIDAIYREHAPEVVFCRHIGEADDGDPFTAAPDDAPFAETATRLYLWRRRFTTAELIEHQRTHSDHIIMAADRREQLLTALAETVDHHGGTYDYPYVCRLWTARRM